MGERPPVEEVFGFRLVERIGEGGMASVWRAEHAVLGRVVALKLLDPVLARQEQVVSRFLQEARIEATLDHPNVLRVENVSQDPPAILMEYVDGRALDEVIGREVGPIPLARALPLMEQILAGVAHAHAAGAVHRDLKPANVLVDRAGQVKVMDFGIARVLGEARRTRTGATLGTPHYMAPEQILSARAADERSDVYALGATFFEMLAGRPPFDAESDYAVMKAHEQDPPPDPRQFYPAIPEAVVAVLLRALAKRAPRRRGGRRRAALLRPRASGHLRPGLAGRRAGALHGWAAAPRHAHPALSARGDAGDERPVGGGLGRARVQEPGAPGCSRDAGELVRRRGFLQRAVLRDGAGGGLPAERGARHTGRGGLLCAGVLGGPRELGLPTAHRGRVGVRLPWRHHRRALRRARRDRLVR